MSTEKNLIAKLVSDDAFRSKLKNATSPADIQKELQDGGFSSVDLAVLVQDAEEAMGTLTAVKSLSEKMSSQGEISDEELENVAGGSGKCDQDTMVCTDVECGQISYT